MKHAFMIGFFVPIFIALIRAYLLAKNALPRTTAMDRLLDFASDLGCGVFWGLLAMLFWWLWN